MLAVEKSLVHVVKPHSHTLRDYIRCLKGLEWHGQGEALLEQGYEEERARVVQVSFRAQWLLLPADDEAPLRPYPSAILVAVTAQAHRIFQINVRLFKRTMALGVRVSLIL